MDRREFLKICFGATAAAGVSMPLVDSVLRELGPIPIGVPSSPKSAFDHTREYGSAIKWSRVFVEEKSDISGFYRGLQEFLVEKARIVLPKGTRFELRRAIPLDFGRTEALAWYSQHTSMFADRDWHEGVNPFGEEPYDPKAGFYLSARVIA